MTPTTSTTVMGVIGDILVALQMMRIGFTEKDYALRHHGGYLGAIVRSKLESFNRIMAKYQNPMAEQSSVNCVNNCGDGGK
jgi:D-arabinose 5-phosphate isomerase GutQ